jgi:plasmid stability protein
MPQLTIRKVDAEVVKALRIRAAVSGRSAEAELREILRKVLLQPGSRTSLEEYLRTMPEVGDDSDFSRIEGGMRWSDAKGSVSD